MVVWPLLYRLAFWIFFIAFLGVYNTGILIKFIFSPLKAKNLISWYLYVDILFHFDISSPFFVIDIHFVEHKSQFSLNI